MYSLQHVGHRVVSADSSYSKWRPHIEHCVSAALESPPWHEAVLRETEVRVQSGDERILDWRDAKEELRKLFK